MAEQPILDSLKSIQDSLHDLTSRVAKLEVGKTATEIEVTSGDNTNNNNRSRSSDEVDTQQAQQEETVDQATTGEDRQLSSIPLPLQGGSFGAREGEIQRDFERIRDSLSRIPLPNNLRVHDTSTGIKSDCRPQLKIIQKSARFAETALKLLASLDSPTPTTLSYDNVDINNLYTVLKAQISFLQAEYSNLVVRSTFNDETSRLFRSLEASSSSFNERSLQNIRVAAELAAVSNRTTNSRGRGNFAPRRFRGGYDNRRPYQNYHYRGSGNHFPRQLQSPFPSHPSGDSQHDD